MAGSGEIDRGRLDGILLLRTVVPAVGNMDERVVLTVQVLSEGAKTGGERGGGRLRDP